MMVTSAQLLRSTCWQGRWTVAKIIQSSRSGFARLFAGLRRSYAYRWYEVEGASF